MVRTWKEPSTKAREMAIVTLVLVVVMVMVRLIAEIKSSNKRQEKTDTQMVKMKVRMVDGWIHRNSGEIAVEEMKLAEIEVEVMVMVVEKVTVMIMAH